MGIWRYEQNPVIVPEDVQPFMEGYEVVGAFNPAAVRFGDEVVLLLRVAERPVTTHPDIQRTAIYDSAADKVVIKEFSFDDPANDFLDSRMTVTPEGKFLTSLSHLRVARSSDGIHFKIEDTPALFAANKYEEFGLEDARITEIEGVYYITYVAVSDVGVLTCLASTKDFVNYQRHGVISLCDNKDVMLFAGKAAGKYWLLQRPVTPLFEKYNMWVSESLDLKNWGNHRFLIAAEKGSWDCARIGGGAPPVRIDEGWLEIYHGVDGDGRYSLGAVLTDGNEPWRVIGRSSEPVMVPETDYELEGFFGNVVFSCGLLCEKGKLKIYYGVADTSTAYAEIDLADVLKTLKQVS